MTEIIVKEINNRSGLKRFVKFPHRLYNANPNWIPPLHADELTTLDWNKNPAFATAKARYWMAYKNDNPVGRIAAIALEQEDLIRFGWVDFIQDIEVAKALFEPVETWGKTLHLKGIHGPFGFTDFDFQGMLTKGFNEFGTITTLYNYEYYPEFLETLGYVSKAEWIEKKVPMPSYVPEKLEKMANWSEEKFGFKVARFKNKKSMLKYADEGLDVVNKSYAPLLGFHAFSKEQSDFYIKQYFNFAKTDFVCIVQDQNGKMAGFGLIMPSLAKAFKKANGKLFPFGFIHILKALSKNNAVDSFIVGVLPEHQRKGVNAVIVRSLLLSVIKHKVNMAFINPSLADNNKVLGLWKSFEGEKDYRWRKCFFKAF